MNDDVFKKMDLDLGNEEEKTDEDKLEVSEETSVEEEITTEDSVEEESEVTQNPENENEYIFNKEEEDETPFDEKDELVEQLNEDGTIEAGNIQPEMFEALEDSNVTEEDVLEDIKQKAPKAAVRYLIRGFWWTFILLLSIIFGIDAIWTFADKFDKFITSAKGADASGEAMAVFDAIEKFFIAFAYMFEALLFIFFILLSIVMMIKNYRPWIIYRKSTEHKRYQDRIVKAKIQITHLQKELRNDGIETQLKHVVIEPEEHFLPSKNGKQVRAKEYYSDLKKEINHLMLKKKKVNEAVKEVKEEVEDKENK